MLREHSEGASVIRADPVRRQQLGIVQYLAKAIRGFEVAPTVSTKVDRSSLFVS